MSIDYDDNYFLSEIKRHLPNTLYIALQQYRHTYQFRHRKCYRCGLYGHTAGECNIRCIHCNGNHDPLHCLDRICHLYGKICKFINKPNYKDLQESTIALMRISMGIQEKTTKGYYTSSLQVTTITQGNLSYVINSPDSNNQGVATENKEEQSSISSDDDMHEILDSDSDSESEQSLNNDKEKVSVKGIQDKPTNIIKNADSACGLLSSKKERVVNKEEKISIMDDIMSFFSLKKDLKPTSKPQTTPMTPNTPIVTYHNNQLIYTPSQDKINEIKKAIKLKENTLSMVTGFWKNYKEMKKSVNERNLMARKVQKLGGIISNYTRKIKEKEATLTALGVKKDQIYKDIRKKFEESKKKAENIIQERTARANIMIADAKGVKINKKIIQKYNKEIVQLKKKLLFMFSRINNDRWRTGNQIGEWTKYRINNRHNYYNYIPGRVEKDSIRITEEKQREYDLLSKKLESLEAICLAYKNQNQEILQGREHYYTRKRPARKGILEMFEYQDPESEDYVDDVW